MCLGRGGGVLDCCENVHFVNPGIGSVFFFLGPVRSEFFFKCELKSE